MEGVMGLCDCVRETAYALHVYLGPGHFESVYEAGLAHRLRKTGLKVDQQVQLRIYDEDGTTLGSCVPDLLVEDTLIVELKAATRLSAEHTAQVLGYLRASRSEHALLINFGSATFEIRKFTRGVTASARPPSA